MINIGVHRPARAKRLNMYEMPSGAPEQKTFGLISPRNRQPIAAQHSISA
jgi:hypothetical protein